MKTETITFRLFPEEKSALLTACKEADITAAQVMRQLAREWVKKHLAKAETKATKEEQKRNRQK